MKNLLVLLFLIFEFSCYTQNNYPSNYFGDPLEIPLLLSGTFGELRNNHFHAGLDIKTQKKEGLHVLATADGYVSRIRVALWGYGKAIYINHPNGYTSVYAHLSKFNDSIEKHVRAIQYKNENFETGNIFLKPNQIPIKKGEIIAFSGSTGGFVFPHLHYEIRNTKSEKIINPMFFGLIPADSISPTIQSIMGYPMNEISRIDNSNSKSILAVSKIDAQHYKTSKISASGKIGFGIEVFDQLNNATNHNGVFSLEMTVNGKQVYYHDVETFSFAESKYINLLIDYPYFQDFNKRYQKTHKVSGNSLSIFKNLVSDGIIDVKEGLNYNVKIIAKDFKGNTATITIPIEGKESNTIFAKPKDSTKYKIEKEKFAKFTQENVTIAFPKNTFYEDFYLDFKIVNAVAQIHKPTIPLDKNFTLTFNVSRFSSKEKKQMYIANINNKKYPRYQYTKKKDSIFYTTTKTLGNYTLKADDIKPKIYSLDFSEGQWISNYKTITVKILDNESGIKNYRATINGDWILMEYNLKKKQLTYNFSDKKLVGNKHIFKLVVSDNVGNTNSLERTFYRKP